MTRQYTEADCDHARKIVLDAFDIKAVKTELVNFNTGLLVEGLTIGNGRLLATPFAGGEPHEIVAHLKSLGWPLRRGPLPYRQAVEVPPFTPEQAHQAIMEAEAAFASYASGEKTSGK